MTANTAYRTGTVTKMCFAVVPPFTFATAVASNASLAQTDVLTPYLFVIRSGKTSSRKMTIYTRLRHCRVVLSDDSNTATASCRSTSMLCDLSSVRELSAIFAGDCPHAKQRLVRTYPIASVTMASSRGKYPGLQPFPGSTSRVSRVDLKAVASIWSNRVLKVAMY
jgi:hypothetical protein